MLVDCLARGSDLRRKATLDAVGIGPRLVAGILEEHGHEVDIIQCEEAVRAPGALRGYEVLMVSGMSTDVNSMLRVVSRWRGGPAVAGGPSFVDWSTLLHKGFDYVVWGEGEGSLPQLMKALDRGEGFENVPNLIWRKKKSVIRNPGPAWINPPLLWRYEPSVAAIKSYPGWWGARVYVEVVRGCSNFFRPTLELADGKRCILCNKCREGPLKSRIHCPLNIPPGCGYCSVPALFGPARSRPIHKIVNEVKALIRLGVRRIVLSGPDFLDYGRDWLVAPEPLTDPRNPSPNTDAINELLYRLTSLPEVSSGEVYVMIENVKPNLVTEEVAGILGKYLRGTPVHIGLESGDENHHKALGRPSTVEEVLKAVKLLRKHGLRPYVYVIHGLPGEDDSVISNTIRSLKKIWSAGVEKITLYRFTPLKGTAFEGFPRPPPAVKSRAKPLYEFIKELNYEAKKRLIGSVVKAVGVTYLGDKKLVAYTLPHGPVIKVVDADKGLVGCVFRVKVVKAASDRVVIGVPIRKRTK